MWGCGGISVCVGCGRISVYVGCGGISVLGVWWDQCMCGGVVGSVYVWGCGRISVCVGVW